MDFLLHIANVLYLFSYSVKDIVALRILTVAAACCLIPFFIFRAEPLWAAVGWNLLFTCINLYRIIVLLRERRPVEFSKRESELYKRTFYSMSDRQFAKLLKTGQWKTADSETCLLESGRIPQYFLVLVDGAISIKKSGRVVSQLAEGDFVGETALISEYPIPTEVITSRKTEYVCWPTKQLKELFEDQPILHANFQRMISNQLIRSLPQFARSA